jgi:hypothetical protein
LRTFQQVQDVLGARGKIVEQLLSEEQPSVSFRWTNLTASTQKREVRVNLFETGDFGGVVLLGDAANEVVFNNAGAFVCKDCNPPVDACGHRPGWIPHDLHWDNFDCRCTLVGPQNLKHPLCK